MSQYGRSNAIPNVELGLRTQFSKFGQPFDPWKVTRAFISTRDPRDSLYNSQDLLQEIPEAGIQKVGLGLYEYKVASTTINAVGKFYDSVEFQLEDQGPLYLIVNTFQVTADGLPKLGYITVKELRDEGLTDTTKYPDAFLNSRIAYNTKLIENYTGRWFEARDMILDIDGHGAYNLQLEFPIVNIKKVTLLDREFPVTQVFTFELDDITIYNRHITMRMMEPDDREDPRIANVYFPKGRQNIRIDGTFGYTEYDGSTPVMIKRALMLMVMRDKELLASNRRNASLLRGLSGRLQSESTDGHSYSLAVPTPSAGATPYFTGDDEIDHILHSFVRPMKLGQGLGANISTSVDGGADSNRFRDGFDFYFGRSV
ncbi:hypothetical protein MASR1M48_17390 [Lactococcus petauri]